VLRFGRGRLLFLGLGLAGSYRLGWNRAYNLLRILRCSWLSLPIWPPVETSRLGDISMVVTSPKGGTLLIWSELSISKFILNLALVLVLKFHGFVCVAKVERVAIE
jgi:hypothetical protein